MKLQLEERIRKTKGNSYIASGRVLNFKCLGKHACDTLYLQLSRDGKIDLTMCITPEEAEIISYQLSVVANER